MLPPVTELLAFAVTSHGLGVFGPVALPVIRMARPPLLLAIAADVAVFGIGGDLLPVVVGATLTLAIGFTANRLQGPKLGRLKGLLTVAAAPFPHTAVVAPRRGARDGPAQTTKRADLFLAGIGRMANEHRLRTAYRPAAGLETAVECIPRPRRCLCPQLQIWLQSPQRIGPALSQQSGKGLPAFRLDQSVVI